MHGQTATGLDANEPDAATVPPSYALDNTGLTPTVAHNQWLLFPLARLSTFPWSEPAQLPWDYRSLLNDLAHQTKITLITDAFAAKGISQRTGLDRIRHLETSKLWLQDLVLNNRITVRKTQSESNLADILTKHLDAKGIEMHMNAMQSKRVTGIHKLGLTLNT